MGRIISQGLVCNVSFADVALADLDLDNLATPNDSSQPRTDGQHRSFCGSNRPEVGYLRSE